MASITPVLFEINRKPHDKIHNHFFHTKKLAWKIGASDRDNIGLNTAPYPTIYEQIDVYINNAPLIDILLTHTRVYEEFRQFNSLKNLAMTVSINLNDRQPHIYADDQRPLYNVLSYVRHVTLFLELSPNTMNPDSVQRERYKMTDFITRIAAATPCAKTFRIALKYPKGLVADTDLQHQLDGFNTEQPVLEDIFKAFDYLHLIQMGKGCATSLMCLRSGKG